LRESVIQSPASEKADDPPVPCVTQPRPVDLLEWVAEVEDARKPALGLGHEAFPVEFGVVELRGLEPRTEPGETGSELRVLSSCVVRPALRVLRICPGVLRDVTVLDPN